MHAVIEKHHCTDGINSLTSGYTISLSDAAYKCVRKREEEIGSIAEGILSSSSYHCY